jgi:hypothetical protein
VLATEHTTLLMTSHLLEVAYIDLIRRSDGGEHAPTTAPEVNAVTAIAAQEVVRAIKSPTSQAGARFTLAPAAR